MRDYESTPRPLVEDHYHIRDLIEKQERRTEERNRFRSQREALESLANDISRYPDFGTLDFWCDRCQVDFIARARKQVDSWGLVSYYKTKHRCGTWCIRHVTQRGRDSYFFRSKRVAYDRMANSVEMIQPFQTGFNMVYGKK